jgi:hypothetical protein
MRSTRHTLNTRELWCVVVKLHLGRIASIGWARNGELVRIWKEVIVNVAIFWDIASYSPYVKRRFGGTYHFHLQDITAEQKFCLATCYTLVSLLR